MNFQRIFEIQKKFEVKKLKAPLKILRIFLKNHANLIFLVYIYDNKN